MRKTIVLASDSKFLRQMLTTIKSICYHNDNVTFYVLNNDISKEWINDINLKLKKINCELIDVKIDSSYFKNFKTLSHISTATFFRYFIPEKIQENKVLYLDSDLIVLGCLDELFNVYMGNNVIAASKDIICISYDKNEVEFNAGVMLIDNNLLKKENLFSKAISIHSDIKYNLKNSDQSVLNILFKNKWLELSSRFNTQVGIEFVNKIDKKKIVINYEKDPLIVHFTTSNKPWNKQKIGIIGRLNLIGEINLKEFLTGNIEISYQDLWFFYDSLNFEDIIKVKW